MGSACYQISDFFYLNGPVFVVTHKNCLLSRSFNLLILENVFLLQKLISLTCQNLLKCKPGHMIKLFPFSILAIAIFGVCSFSKKSTANLRVVRTSATE